MAEERIGLRVGLINKACSMAMRAHSSPGKPYLYVNSRSSTEAIFGFTGAWHVRDWFAPNKPFGETKINLQLFLSMKPISDHNPALVNEASPQRFEAVLTNSTLKAEICLPKQLLRTQHVFLAFSVRILNQVGLKGKEN
ncbi:defense response [Ancistrocladus abbreviatus]